MPLTSSFAMYLSSLPNRTYEMKCLSIYSLFLWIFVIFFMEILNGNHSKFWLSLFDVVFLPSLSKFPVVYIIYFDNCLFLREWHVVVTLLLQDPLDIKSNKKFPLTLRLVVLAVVVVCGIYICSICLEQIGVRTNTNLLSLRLRVFNQPCHPSRVEDSEVPYLHYPEPETYSR